MRLKTWTEYQKMVSVGSGKLCSDACQTIHACCTVMLGESCGMIMRPDGVEAIS